MYWPSPGLSPGLLRSAISANPSRQCNLHPPTQLQGVPRRSAYAGRRGLARTLSFRPGYVKTVVSRATAVVVSQELKQRLFSNGQLCPARIGCHSRLDQVQASISPQETGLACAYGATTDPPICSFFCSLSTLSTISQPSRACGSEGLRA